MLNGLYRIYSCIFRGQLSDSGTQSKFWLRSVSIKGTNLQKSFTGKPAFDTLTAMSVERNATKGQSPRLSSAELLDIDSACLILFMDKKELSLILLDFLSCFHFGSSCAPTRHSINSTHGQGVHSTSHIITHCEEVSEFLTLIHKFTLQPSILESILSSTWCKFDPDTAYVVCISVWLGFPYRFSFRFIWYSYHFFLMWYPYHLVFLIWNPYHSVSLMW